MHNVHNAVIRRYVRMGHECMSASKVLLPEGDLDPIYSACNTMFLLSVRYATHKKQLTKLKLEKTPGKAYTV